MTLKEAIEILDREMPDCYSVRLGMDRWHHRLSDNKDVTELDFSISLVTKPPRQAVVFFQRHKDLGLLVQLALAFTKLTASTVEDLAL